MLDWLRPKVRRAAPSQAFYRNLETLRLADTQTQQLLAMMISEELNALDQSDLKSPRHARRREQIVSGRHHAMREGALDERHPRYAAHALLEALYDAADEQREHLAALSADARSWVDSINTAPRRQQPHDQLSPPLIAPRPPSPNPEHTPQSGAGVRQGRGAPTSQDVGAPLTGDETVAPSEGRTKERMKTFVILFAAISIYVVAVGISTAIFGKGSLGLWLGGLFGTLIFVYLMQLAKEG